MRIISLFMLLMALVVIVGCSQQTVGMPDKVVIERINVENDTYEVIKTVTDKEEISDIIQLVESTNWEHGQIQVSMARPADFKINNTDYLLWITPSRDRFRWRVNMGNYQKENPKNCTY
ncbi:hypothetical protein D0S48_13530 [Psychrobacillus sp. AK 1817]|uniref:hypothetical protein n=1 Tax=Psychrobacillus sp. AK 1817 TaxID=2303505 RepID=UPI0012A068B7|nr:hypothetical protein [Psychrobacillus sp. AK 1817]QEY21604.1 hypothetical protein D0S48_13530 [Psychrobacillus sp. AK 1817]